MTFADSNGPIDCDAPNTKGWADTVAFIETLSDAPALKELATKGATEDLDGLMIELEDAQSEDADVQEVLDAVDEAASLADGILIVTD